MHSPAWSQIGQSSGWLMRRNSIVAARGALDLVGRGLDREAVLQRRRAGGLDLRACPRSRPGTCGTGRRPRGAGGSRSGGCRCRRASRRRSGSGSSGPRSALPSKMTVKVSFGGGGGAARGGGAVGALLMPSPAAAFAPTRQRLCSTWYRNSSRNFGTPRGRARPRASAKHADRHAVGHLAGDAGQQVDVLDAALALLDARRGPGRARCVPSRQGVHWPQDSCEKNFEDVLIARDDAGVLVHHDDRGRAEHRALGGDAVEVERAVLDLGGP